MYLEHFLEVKFYKSLKLRSIRNISLRTDSTHFLIFFIFVFVSINKISLHLLHIVYANYYYIL